jgi:hypothetical protein
VLRAPQSYLVRPAAATTAAAPVAAVDSYWADINTGNYAGAWTYLAPGITSESSFVANERQTGVESATFTGSLGASSASSATVNVASLRTVDHEYGCRTWSGAYSMTRQSGRWLIARADITPKTCSG